MKNENGFLCKIFLQKYQENVNKQNTHKRQLGEHEVVRREREQERNRKRENFFS